MSFNMTSYKGTLRFLTSPREYIPPLALVMFDIVMMTTITKTEIEMAKLKMRDSIVVVGEEFLLCMCQHKMFIT